MTIRQGFIKILIKNKIKIKFNNIKSIRSLKIKEKDTVLTITGLIIMNHHFKVKEV